MTTKTWYSEDWVQLIEQTWRNLQSGKEIKVSAISILEKQNVTLDYRIDAIQYQLVHLHNLLVSLILMKDNLIHFKWWDQYFPDIPSNDYKMENASRFFEMVTYGTFIGYFSTLESFIRSVHFALDNELTVKRHDSFYKIRKSLYESYLTISFPELNSYFQLMQTLRNCVHNHGVYFDSKNQLLTITYKNLTYNFIHGQPPNCLHPEFIIACINDAFQITFETSTSPKVLAIPVIENRYDLIGKHETCI